MQNVRMLCNISITIKIYEIEYIKLSQNCSNIPKDLSQSSGSYSIELVVSFVLSTIIGLIECPWNMSGSSKVLFSYLILFFHHLHVVCFIYALLKKIHLNYNLKSLVIKIIYHIKRYEMLKNQATVPFSLSPFTLSGCNSMSTFVSLSISGSSYDSTKRF